MYVCTETAASDNHRQLCDEGSDGTWWSEGHCITKRTPQDNSPRVATGMHCRRNHFRSSTSKWKQAAPRASAAAHLWKFAQHRVRPSKSRDAASYSSKHARAFKKTSWKSKRWIDMVQMSTVSRICWILLVCCNVFGISSHVSTIGTPSQQYFVITLTMKPLEFAHNLRP